MSILGTNCRHDDRYRRHEDDSAAVYCTVCEINRLRAELTDTKSQLRLAEAEVAKLDKGLRYCYLCGESEIDCDLEACFECNQPVCAECSHEIESDEGDSLGVMCDECAAKAGGDT